MTTAFIITGSTLLLLFLNWFFFFYRNDKVYYFRKRVIDLSCKRNIKLIHQFKKPKDFYNRLPSYHAMMFNIFKPIKLETYFTKKEIKELLENE